MSSWNVRRPRSESGVLVELAMDTYGTLSWMQ